MDFDVLTYQYRQMTETGIIMSFKGAFAQPIIVEIGQTLRAKIASQPIESLSERTLLIKKMFAIFIELAQNIMFYSAEKEFDEHGKECGVGLLVISEHKDTLCVSSVNQVAADDVERITAKFAALQGLTKDQLKERYNEQRRMPRNSSKGAGLGFLEIARKADLPIASTFRPLSEQHSLFCLSAHINKL